MKKLITACWLISALIISQNTLAQKQKPAGPCCSVLSTGPVDGLKSDPTSPVDGIVLMRNNTTGQTFQFNADALDVNNLHVGDAINADILSNKITAIKGVTRTYSISHPNPVQPCCSVASIHPNPEAPCCSIVSVQSNGNAYSFSVPKNISSTLKVGQPVSLILQNTYALFKTNINGAISTYGYPVENKNFNNNVKPLAPCCSVLSTGPVDGLKPDPTSPVDGIVLMRNNTTGQTFQFNADALDVNNLHVGDAINADILSNKITAIKGVERTYSIRHPNPGQPCCAVAGIHPNPGSPCCSIVSVQSNGNAYSFSVPKNISTTLKVGQPVSLILQNTYALFKTNINGTESAYSYPVQNSSATNSYQPWEIKPDPTIKGIGGEIALEIPKELRYNTNLEFFNAGEKTNRVASWFGENKAKLLPGFYDVAIDSRDTIKNVPVELAKQTRLKLGVFMVSGYSNAKLENTVTHQKFNYGAPFKVLLPEGTYYLNGNKKNPIVIKDGELTEL